MAGDYPRRGDDDKGGPGRRHRAPPHGITRTASTSREDPLIRGIRDGLAGIVDGVGQAATNAVDSVGRKISGWRRSRNRRVAAVWPIAQPGPQKRRLARPRRAEDDEQRLHTRGAHPPQHFQAAHDLGVASEEHRRIGLLQRCPAPIRGTVGITPAAATRSAPRRLSGRVAPACGQTCWYSAAFVVAPRPSFEFRGPFGTPAHAGKSGAVARRGRWFLAQ